MITFSQTSNEPYDRHDYEIVLKTGKTVTYDNWEQTLEYWFAHCQIPDFLDHVMIKDKKKVKSKGFGK